MTESQKIHPSVIDMDSVLATIKDYREASELNKPVVYIRELACILFPPKDTPRGQRNSIRRLRYFIRQDPELRAKMLAAGYNTHRNYLTRRQLSILSWYI